MLADLEIGGGFASLWVGGRGRGSFVLGGSCPILLGIFLIFGEFFGFRQKLGGGTGVVPSPIPCMLIRNRYEFVLYTSNCIFFLSDICSFLIIGSKSPFGFFFNFKNRRISFHLAAGRSMRHWMRHWPLAFTGISSTNSWYSTTNQTAKNYSSQMMVIFKIGEIHFVKRNIFL